MVKKHHHEADITRLGQVPRDTDIVSVKIDYLVPELYEMRADSTELTNASIRIS